MFLHSCPFLSLYWFQNSNSENKCRNDSYCEERRPNREVRNYSFSKMEEIKKRGGGRNYYHEECFPKQCVYSACLTLNCDILKSIIVTKTISSPLPQNGFSYSGHAILIFDDSGKDLVCSLPLHTVRALNFLARAIKHKAEMVSLSNPSPPVTSKTPDVLPSR